MPRDSEGNYYACDACTSIRRRCSYAHGNRQSPVKRVKRAEGDPRPGPSVLGGRIIVQPSHAQKAASQNPTSDKAKSLHPSEVSQRLLRPRSSTRDKDVASPQRKKRRLNGTEPSSSATKASLSSSNPGAAPNPAMRSPSDRPRVPSPLASPSHSRVQTPPAPSPIIPTSVVHPMTAPSRPVEHHGKLSSKSYAQRGSTLNIVIDAQVRTSPTSSSSTPLPRQTLTQTWPVIPIVTSPRRENAIEHLSPIRYSAVQVQTTPMPPPPNTSPTEQRQSPTHSLTGAVATASSSHGPGITGSSSFPHYSAAQVQTGPVLASSSTSFPCQGQTSTGTLSGTAPIASSSCREALVERISPTQNALSLCQLDFTIAKNNLTAAEANHKSLLDAIAECDRMAIPAPSTSNSSSADQGPSSMETIPSIFISRREALVERASPTRSALALCQLDFSIAQKNLAVAEANHQLVLTAIAEHDRMARRSAP